MNKLKISLWQENNLRILADYLLSGNLKAGFNMSFFSSMGNSGMFRSDCGSIGCAVGHGPYAGISKDANETFLQYSVRVFGFKGDSKEWKWCFHNYWQPTDGTPEGAGKRILILLEEGLPDDWERQLFRLKEISY